MKSDRFRKKYVRAALNGLFYGALRLLAPVAGYMPPGLSRWIAEAVGRAVFWVARPARRAAMENFDIVFPSMPLRRRLIILRKFFVGLIALPFEVMYYVRHLPQLRPIRIIGRHHLDEALGEGRGVIGVMAHFGNFPVMQMKIASLGYEVHALTRPMRNHRVGDYLHRLREKAGVRTIYSRPRREAVEKSLKLLRENSLVVMPMDHDFREDGVMVEFFGQPASTAVGAIVLAHRTGARLVPMFIAKGPDGRPFVHIDPAVELEPGNSREESVIRTAGRVNKVFEGWIREYPWEWAWIHRRWASAGARQRKD
jgi:KDO2-lipid IV(A) lauroyltransferase